MPAPPPPLVDATWDSAWASALDDLELTLEQTEQLLGGGDPHEALDSATWAPPQIDAPLPGVLLERAQGLLARQRELMGLTVTAMSEARQEIVVLGKVSSFAGASPAQRPVYLDIRA